MTLRKSTHRILTAITAVVLASPGLAQFAQQGNKLVGTGPGLPSAQGDSVALSADGSTLAVGGSSDNNYMGAVWIYTRANGVWTQQGDKLVGTGSAGPFPQQGFSVALSANGNTLIVGGPNDGYDGTTGFSVGAFWIFVRSNGVWSQQGPKKVTIGATPSAQQGASVGLSADGNTAIIGGPSDGATGATWIFTRTGINWSQQGPKLVGASATGNANQGISVALSADGNTALIGGFHDNSNRGAAWVFARSGEVWTQDPSKLVGGDAATSPNFGSMMGSAVALSGDGNTAIVGGPGDSLGAGAVWVFTRGAGFWVQQGNKLVGTGALTAANQGRSVAISNDGNTAVVGGPLDDGQGLDTNGAAWVFKRVTGWTQQGSKLVGAGGVHGTVPGSATPIGPRQGISIALSSDANTMAVGGNGDTSSRGAAWVFGQGLPLPPHFSVTAPATVAANTAFNFTVTAQDSSNATLTGYTGTVRFSSTDNNATIPAETTLTAGTGTFSATFRTAGNQSMTASDTVNSSITGNSGTIAVTPAVGNGSFLQQGAKLTGTGLTGRAQQGTAVALSRDGSTLAVGVPSDNTSAGAVLVYVRTGGVWTQQGGKLVGTGAAGTTAQQGTSVAISADGNTMIEGGNFDGAAGHTGAVWVFIRNNGVWSQQGAKLVGTVAAGAALQGQSVALSADGNTAIVGGPGDSSGAGAIWVFTRDGTGVWSQQGNKILGTGATGAAAMGKAVAVAADGNTALAGGNLDSNSAGATWVFTRTGAVWTQQGNKLVGAGVTGATAGQGSAVALSGDGNTALVGGPGDSANAGAAWVFTRAAGTWTQQGSKLVGVGGTSAALQGTSVALSSEGNQAAIGGPGDTPATPQDTTGATWIFRRTSGVWTQQGLKLVGSGAVHANNGAGTPVGSSQGIAVAMSGDGNTVAAGGNRDNGDIGAVWIFALPHFTISSPPTANGGTAFGFTVAAFDANNAPMAGYAGTVHFTSTDGSATLPPDTALTGGTGAFQATLRSGGAHTISAADIANSGLNGTSSPIVVALPPPSGTQYTQQGNKLVGSGAVGAASFGPVALSADGNTLAVGGYNDNSQAGGVWVYTRTGGTWTQQGAKLLGTGATGAASQGISVALSADGNTLIEGGYTDGSNTGAAWVFTRTAGVWAQQGVKLVGSGAAGNGNQGISVALAADGNTAIVGGSSDSSGAGAAWIFTRTGGVWAQEGGKLVGTGAVSGQLGVVGQGRHVALSGDGNTAAIGGTGDNAQVGGVWVFTRTAGVWTQQGAKLVGSGPTGTSQQGAVALSNDGSTLLVGGSGDNYSQGAAWVFTRTAGAWTQQGGKLLVTGASNSRINGIGLGMRVSLSSDGNTALLGAPFDGGFELGASTGAAWIFKRSGGTWSQYTKLVGAGGVNGTMTGGFPIGPGQGNFVALSADAGTAALGGNQDNSGVGAVWIFSLTQTRLTIGAPSSATAGTPFNFTVSALDNNNAPVTNFAGTLKFTGSDIAGALPGDATLTGGTGTFAATLRTGGNQTITVADKSNSALAAASGAIAVNGAPVAAQWFSQQGNKLVGSSASGTPGFGPVALSADGNTLAVGGPNDNNSAGAVWIYTRTNGVWSQQGGKLVGSGAAGAAAQGGSVALSADGNTLIEGGSGDSGGVGAAWVFIRNNGAWTQQGNKLIGAGAVGAARQGAVALAADGNTVIVGGPGDNALAGASWIFTRDGSGVWTQQGNKLTGTGPTGTQSQQGFAVALSADGNTALSSGNNDNQGAGAVWVFTRSSGAWTQQGAKLAPNDASPVGTQVFFGASVSLASDGNTAIVGGIADTRYRGAAWIFRRTSGAWSQQGNKLVAVDLDSPCTACAIDQGFAVAMSGDGNMALVGAPEDSSVGVTDATGAAVVYRRNSSGVWGQPNAKLVGAGGIHSVTGGGQATGPSEGRYVALSADGSTAAIGGPGDNANVGAVWVFALPRFSFTTPATAISGTPFNFTVSALDAGNQLFPNYFGTLHFTSTDGAATVPADASLSAGVLNLPATLRTGGNQTISAVDTTNSGQRGTSSPIALPVSVTPPSPVWVSPAGGNSSSQPMTFVFNDPRGYQDLSVVNVLVNNFIDGRGACYLAYIVAQGTLVLVNDAGDAGGPYAGNATLGNPTPISNSQCSVQLISATGSGNTLTLMLGFIWKTAFAGDKIIHLAARDVGENNSGWYPLGVWRAPGGTPTTSTSVVSMTPFRGNGPGPTQFTFTFSDTKGFQDLGVENILVNNALDGRRACYLAYSRPGNTLFLVNDNGDGLLPGKSLAAPEGLSNNQCAVSWGANAVTGSGNNLTLTLTFSFSASFGGNRIIYVAARDVNEANNTDWHAMGTWTTTFTLGIGRPAGATLDTGNPLSTGLAGFFIMNEGSGTVDRNLVSNQNAIFSGASIPTWNTGDPSIVFNGGSPLNSYLDAGTDLAFDKLTNGQMTIVAKVFLNNTANQGIAEKNDGNTGDSGFAFGVASFGVLQLTVERVSSNLRVQGGGIPSGQWVQVAVTFDGTVGSADSVHLYLNGTELSKVLNNSGSGAIGFAGATNQPLRIGTAGYDFPGSLNGKMQYLAIYKGRILSAGELGQLDANLPLR